jgi:hypothetical protein
MIQARMVRKQTDPPWEIATRVAASRSCRNFSRRHCGVLGRVADIDARSSSRFPTSYRIAGPAGGALAVPRGHEVVPVVNRLSRRFRHVILTQDWHTPGHLSFASSHPGRNPYDVIEAPYGPQVLWPDHCVQGTAGAAFRHDLDVPHAQLITRKGYHREIDS